MMPQKLVDKYAKVFNEQNGIGACDIDSFESDKLVKYEYQKRPFDLPLGVVVGSKRSKEGRLEIYETQIQHTLLSSATGRGKSQGFILNNIFSITPKTGASYIIADAKGELTVASYKSCVEKYGKDSVHVLNMNDVNHTTLFVNPLEKMARDYLEAQQLDERERKKREDYVFSKVQAFVASLFEIRSTNDTSWDIGAQDVLQAIIAGLIEDTAGDYSSFRCGGLRKKLKPEQVTLERVNYVFCQFDWRDNERIFSGDKGFFVSRPDSSFAKQRAKTVFGAASAGTKTSYLSLISSYLAPYSNPKVCKILSKNNFDIVKLTQNKPSVIFIVYDSTDMVMNKLLSNILSWSIDALKLEYSKTSLPLKNPVVFLCDEFSSLPPSDCFPSVCSIGRGMNIYLIMVVQSICQLSPYKDKTDVLTENSGIKIFLGDNNYSSAKASSIELGMSDQLSKSGLMNGQISFIEKPNVDAEKLLHNMKPGETFVKIAGMKPLRSQFCFHYQTDEYYNNPRMELCSITAPQFDEDEEDDEAKEIERARELLERRRLEIMRQMMESDEDEN